LIASFVSNIPAKNYQNSVMYDKVIARLSNIFKTLCIIVLTHMTVQGHLGDYGHPSPIS